MSHEISVIVGPTVNLRRLVRPSWAGTLYASPWWPDGPALLPLIDDEEDPGYVTWQGSRAASGGPGGAQALDPALAYWAREASADAAIAYLETNFYGSSGYQVAAAWIDGADAYGPETSWVPQGPPSPPASAPRRPGLMRRRWTRLFGRPAPVPSEPARPRCTSPITEALACLGVAPSGDRDAFAAYGLGSVRNNGDFAQTWTALPPDAPRG